MTGMSRNRESKGISLRTEDAGTTVGVVGEPAEVASPGKNPVSFIAR